MSVANGSQQVKIEDGKLVLETGAPVTATLKFGTPLTGKNRWGNDYFKYTLLVNGEEIAWFAPHKVSEALQRLGARNGSTLVIERGQVRQNGRDKGFYAGSLDGKPFEVTSTGNVVTHGSNNGNGDGQPKMTREQLADAVDALYGNGDTIRNAQQQTVTVELSTRVLTLTYGEVAELYEWFATDGVAFA